MKGKEKINSMEDDEDFQIDLCLFIPGKKTIIREGISVKEISKYIS